MEKIPILIIRTHDPSDKTLERLHDMYKKCNNMQWILSLHLSMKSFDQESDTDVEEYDYLHEVNPRSSVPLSLSFHDTMNNFSPTALIEEYLPQMIKKRLFCFVQTESGYNIKTIKSLNESMKSHSKGKTLFYLKPNLVKLINIFSAMDDVFIHLYTDKTIVDRFQIDNFVKYYDTPRASFAWNYHNECVCMALENKFKINDISDDQRIWVFEDDVIFTGNIYDEFIKIYNNTELDLLGSKSHKFTPNPRVISSATDKFKEIYISDVNKQVNKYFEHIVCMSGKYTKMMINTLDQGINALSEVSSIEYCYNANMIYLDINPKYYSLQYNWRLEKGFIDNNAVEEYVEKLKRENKLLLVHPCKF